MPLQQGNTAAARSANIRELISSGRDRRQAIAIALDVARRSAQHKADGGMTSPPVTPWNTRQEAREAFGAGPKLFNSAVPGRTDQHNIDVQAGTYILPADVVSGLGEGNTMAGAAVVERMLGTGPWGTKLPRSGGHGSTIPHPPAAFHEGQFAEGGEAGPDQDGRVPIVVAGGEMQIPPDVVAHHPGLGGLHPMERDPGQYQAALNKGHSILDAFVKHVRKKTIHTLKGLPGPKK